MKIESFFSDLKTANEAVARLKAAGFDRAYVDMNDHYINNRNVETNLPGTEMSVSLSGLVKESDAQGIGKNKAPLNAANPMVSGMAGFEEIADVACRVMVEAKGNEERAMGIIKETGGSLDNPNIQKPKLENDREISLYNALDEIRRKV